MPIIRLLLLLAAQGDENDRARRKGGRAREAEEPPAAAAGAPSHPEILFSNPISVSFERTSINGKEASRRYACIGGERVRGRRGRRRFLGAWASPPISLPFLPISPILFPLSGFCRDFVSPSLRRSVEELSFINPSLCFKFMFCDEKWKHALSLRNRRRNPIRLTWSNRRG